LNSVGARSGERAVLTFSCTRVASASWSAACIGAAAVLSVMTWNAAYADGLAVGGCVGTRGSLNCVVRWGEASDPYVRVVPQPIDQLEKDRAAERDHKWQDHCHPTIAQDYYGVPRYHYSAPGCEFGVIE
jgi:hypothetical protein